MSKPAAGTTCTGTPLTCTGTSYPLHNLYRYTLDMYRYRLPTAYLYRYRLPTAYLYRYSSTCIGTPYGVLPRNVRDFAFSHIFHPQLFSNSSHIKNPPWNLPKNNSKCGLDSIKSIFPQVRAFHLNSKSKYEVRVLIFLTLNLFKSLLV